MRLTPRKGNGGHITAYFATVGSKEARDAGFIRPDGNSRILKKVVDTEKGTLTFQVDWEAEDNRTTCDAERGERVLPLYFIAILA